MAFFWFIIGAGTAIIWSKHHHRKELARAYYVSEIQKRSNGTLSDHDAIVAAAVTQAIEQHSRSLHGWFWGRQSRATQEIGPVPSHPEGVEQKERDSLFASEGFRTPSTQTGDTMAELAEATLDTLLNTIQAAKSKLGDRRLQRDAEAMRQSDAMSSGSGSR